MKQTLPLLTALLLAPLVAMHAAEAPKQKPNILFVITDDIGWGDFCCYNLEAKIPTPSADKLAATGMRFTDAHTTIGVCAPSRYSLLTGSEFNHDAVKGLRGGKSWVWEGGHRVPLIVRWGDGTASGSKIPPGSVRHQMVAVHDMLASFAELAGAKLDPGQIRDSISLFSVLTGNRGDDRPVRQTLISQSHNAGSAKVGPAASPIRKAAGIPDDGTAHALRNGSWKLVFNAQNEAVALFDLAADLNETNNLVTAPEQSDRMDLMVKLYAEIRQSKRSGSAAGNDERSME